MVRQKLMREKGKIRLSRWFQKLAEGDRVAVVRELAVPASFPEQLQGRTGAILGKRGKAYIVKMRGYHDEKIYIIEPVHLKRIQ